MSRATKIWVVVLAILAIALILGVTFTSMSSGVSHS